MSDYLVELHDTMFFHGASAGGPLPWPDLPFRWDRSGIRRQLAVYSDTSLLEAKTRQDGGKIAWLLESPRATRQEYRWVARNALLFDRVLTFEQSLLEELPNALFTPLGGCWLLPEEWKVHAKSKNLSIIASHKKKMPGQELRHEVIRRYGERFDAILGGGYRWIENKIEGLREYRYSMAIENCRQNYYFSEKLIDCLMSGTVPIYWGCPSIGLFFDTRGIITFEHRRELGALLERIGPEDYERRLPAIRRNQELARRFIYPEAHVWENIRDLAQPASPPAQQ